MPRASILWAEVVEKWTLFPDTRLIIFHWYDSDGILNPSYLNSVENAMPQLN